MKDLEKEYPILKEDRLHRRQKQTERHGLVKWLGVLVNIVLKVIFR